jgi:hypothetical protein
MMAGPIMARYVMVRSMPSKYLLMVGSVGRGFGERHDRSVEQSHSAEDDRK